jgi:tRNA A-37 threonylcarbamoyl transferase component Bud32
MPSTHPDADDLDDFLLGRLGDDRHDCVEAHVSDCPACLAVAAGRVPGDTFVELLVAAETRDSLTRSAAGATPSFAFAPTIDGSTTSVPAAPGLLNHPRYRLVRPLGSGGMGSVWLAEHVILRRPVAIKFIRPEFLARPDAADRFRREARAVARLAHPNIVAAHDAEEAGGTCFLAMEYVPGECLAELVRSSGPLPAVEACRVARDVARALATAHAAGLIHRDIKPHNLIRSPDGPTKVLDFGLATAVVGMSDNLTGAHAIVGTPDFIAPEQAEDVRTADARSDLYALGCTLHFLLSGRPPFPEGTLLQKLDAHRGTPAPPIAGLPSGLSAVLSKLMAKRPGDRFQNATDVVAALQPFCEDSAAGSVGDRNTSNECPAPPTRAPSSPKRPPRHIWLIVLGLLFAAAVVAGIVIIVRDKDGKEVGRITVPDGGKFEVVEGGAGTGARDAVRPSFPAGTEYRETHGADLAALRAWFAELPAGYRPVVLTARSEAAPPRFDAVAINDADVTAVKAQLDLDRSGSPHMVDFDTSGAGGFALRLICPFDSGADRPRHHIWVKDGRPWVVFGTTLAELPKKVTDWKRQGLRPTDVYQNAADPGRGDPKRPYGFCLTPAREADWKIDAEVSPDELPAKFAEVREQGWRPELLAAFGTGRNRTFCLLTVPNPGGIDWHGRIDETVAQYESALAEQKRAGRRPLAVTSRGNGDAVRYTGLWIDVPRKR